MSSDETGIDINRRQFVKRVAASGTVGVGLAAAGSGTAAAETRRASPREAESLLATHADDLLSGLEADGVLGDRTDLPTETAIDFVGVTDDQEGSTFMSVPGRREELRVVAEVDRGTLTVSVRPDDGRAFAVLDADSERLAYTPDRGWYDFDDAATCSCPFECANPDTDRLVTECCDSSGCTYLCGCIGG